MSVCCATFNPLSSRFGREAKTGTHTRPVVNDSAGAYGAVQAGTYNSRLLVPETLVDGDRYAVVRRRPTYDELIGLDQLPDWLG